MNKNEQIEIRRKKDDRLFEKQKQKPTNTEEKKKLLVDYKRFKTATIHSLDMQSNCEIE